MKGGREYFAILSMQATNLSRGLDRSKITWASRIGAQPGQTGFPYRAPRSVVTSHRTGKTQ